MQVRTAMHMLADPLSLSSLSLSCLVVIAYRLNDRSWIGAFIIDRLNKGGELHLCGDERFLLLLRLF